MFLNFISKKKGCVLFSYINNLCISVLKIEEIMIVAAWDWVLELFDAIVVDVYIEELFDAIVVDVISTRVKIA